jgi:16S rRNA A1518/A1519 N6-dimethyltransferase RsmA/KsgA/DIM1 with predicted DNA glycosylase/AP lyase activity
MANLQEVRYRYGVDYRKGSPHLSHLALHDRLVEVLRGTIRRLADEGLPLRVLEVGAGHGGFTETALALGCEVTAVDSVLTRGSKLSTTLRARCVMLTAITRF